MHAFCQVEFSTVSNTFFRSRNTPITRSPVSKDDVILLTRVMIACWVECFMSKSKLVFIENVKGVNKVSDMIRVCVLFLWSQWASKCSFHMFCLCFCMSEVISSFRSLRAGSQVFALLMLFLWVSLHTMSSARACSCCASCPLVCSACLPSVWCLWKFCWQCVCWWVWWSERKRTLCLL